MVLHFRLTLSQWSLDMLKIKYKMHRFVNLIFYFIVFALGFFIGGGKLENIKEIFNILFN